MELRHYPARQKRNILIVLLIFLSVLAGGCQPKQPTSTASPPAPTLTPTTASPPTDTPVPQGETILVTSTDDNGPGTLRQAIETAQPYDTITFDPAVFPMDSPAAIMVTSPLPWMDKGHMTIDASNAGVILDGSGVPGEDWGSGISINSESNTIQGLHIINFNGAGIELYENAYHNTIGGDPQSGSGPLGQGNLCSGNIDGILLSGVGHNTVTGNQIGVEIDGVRGNTENGVLLREVGSGNVIGPDNTIVYSGQQGVFILEAEAEGTTITRNLIYGNSIGISDYPRDASTPMAPAILSFDLATGTVSGVTCAGCEVEIFSGEGGGAEHFEDSVTAGAEGYFTFTSDSSFAGLSLVATSTMADGSTSVFSYPTTGERWSGVLQDGNTFPVQVFNALTSEEISEDNRIGTHTYLPDCENTDFLRRFNGLGYKRVRLSFNEMEVPYDLEHPEIPNMADFEPCFDFFLSRGMEVSYILTFWDKETQIAREEVPCERFTNVGVGDPETERYLAFLRSVVPELMAHGIHQYEIWNEPDNFACTQGIVSQNYIKLVALAAPEIREIDPDARILVGATTGAHDRNSQNYLRAIVSSDMIMPLVDGVSLHPFYGPSPAYPDVARYYDTYPAFVEELRMLAHDSGFTGKFFADELTWRTPVNADPGQPWIYPEIVSAKYYTRGILTHLGLDITVGADVGTFMPSIYSTVRNLSTVMAGNTPANLDVEIESAADDLMYYGFDLSNGERLFAIWTNGAAVEYDLGVSATLTFPGSSAQSVTGIDVLNGFEQELVAGTENGNLIIRDLLVKDYPIILRITP
ncbi:MAG: NosD domain-containing protein [Chloroflexota bacterium]